MLSEPKTTLRNQVALNEVQHVRRPHIVEVSPCYVGRLFVEAFGYLQFVVAEETYKSSFFHVAIVDSPWP